MSDPKTVPIKIFPSRAEFAARDFGDEPRIADLIRTRILAPSEKDYLRVNVKIRRQNDMTPRYLIAYLLRKDVYTAEVVRIDVDNNFRATTITHDYDDSAEEEEEAAATSAPEYAGAFDFVAATPVPEIATAKAAVEKLHQLALAAGLRSQTLLGAAANLSNYKQYLTSHLLGFVNIGHGNTSSIMLDDGPLSAAWFNSLAPQTVQPEVVYFNSCQVFNTPLKPAVMQAGARTYVGGIVNLLIGQSEEVCKCFWTKALSSPTHMDDALHQCEQANYPTVGAHGIAGDTGQFSIVAWPNGQVINTADSTPKPLSACVFKNRLYLFWKANDAGNRIFTGASTNGAAWPSGHTINNIDTSPEAVCSCVFNGKLYLFWRANDTGRRIFYSASSDGLNWPDGHTINDLDSTPNSLSATVFKGKLHLFWTANDPGNRIFVTASADGVTFPHGHAINNVDSSPKPVSSCVFNNKLHIFWKANDPGNRIYASTSADGVAWPDGHTINAVDTTPEEPAACVYNNRLYLIWKANDPGNGIYSSGSSDGTIWPNAQRINGLDTTPDGLAACVFQNRMYLFWKANDAGNRIYYSQRAGAFAEFEGEELRVAATSA